MIAENPAAFGVAWGHASVGPAEVFVESAESDELYDWFDLVDHDVDVVGHARVLILAIAQLALDFAADFSSFLNFFRLTKIFPRCDRYTANY